MSDRVELDGVLLSTLRVDRALTQSELAGMTGVTSRTIYRAESGEPVSLRTWRLIAAALEVEPLTLRVRVSA